MNHPADIADGVDSSPGCVSLTLNAPEAVTDVGPLLGLVVACDYANNDFSKLYCYDNSFPNAILGTIDPATCGTTSIGTSVISGTSIRGMSWDETTDTMFAVDGTQLYTVDLATAEVAVVGTITNESSIRAIGVDRDGNMFGYGQDSDMLLAIDKTTAAGTVIGPLGFNAGFGQAMDFDHTDGTCYLFAFNGDNFAGELRSCNTTTGATTLIGTIGSIVPGGSNQWLAGSVRTPDGDPPIFADGFESTDTSAWSNTVP